MISNVFLKFYFLGALWGYVLGLTLGVPNFKSGISKRASMEDFGDIEKLLRECKSGFKSSTIKADYMTVSYICGVQIGSRRCRPISNKYVLYCMS